ncbi:hypothetical protein BGV76_08385 [Limosilactobacillus fermentum]|uniref:RNA-guided endonuclease TnpB family protein n=1 Tax=Limosilactobacillus fermentum TaxID=1613 RepID=UPI000E0ADE79|nr:RNA-guided endonuclease TnpB family protein [Limosilactobacillus fermentum]AXH08043.1 hypothetical protein BGV76_08385 [Limosilactobacillus fermentum]
MKSMAQMKCHYGLKVRIYPSDRQKKIIKINSDASRFIYNEMVAINKELMQLRRVKLPIDIVQDRIKQLTMRQNAKQMSNHYQFLEDKRIDSLTKANAIQNYRKAWNAFRKVHATGVPKFHRKSYQRILSRRARRAKQEHRPLRTSKNYQKQRLLVAKLHAQVFERRRDFLHNVSTTLIKNHDFVAAEELRSKNMLKNHALAMSIADVGWRTFLGMLAYKAELYHRQFLTVNPKNTTQACHECGFVMGTAGTEKLTLADREWTCPKCHAHHVRDHNAAQNILTKGIIKLA